MSGDTSDGGIPSRAQQLSFRKAARTLYLMQLAVTLQGKTFEEELGLKLLERSSTGVSLTEVGKLLLRDAEQHHQLAVQPENRLAALKGQQRRVGAWRFHHNRSIRTTATPRGVLKNVLSESAPTFWSEH
jgi:DNA-binding transcriptional LysR family regulator